MLLLSDHIRHRALRNVRDAEADKYIPGYINVAAPAIPRAPFKGTFFLQNGDKVRSIQNRNNSREFKYNKLIKNTTGFALAIADADIYLTGTGDDRSITQIPVPGNARITNIAATETVFAATTADGDVFIVRPTRRDMTAAGVQAKTVHTTRTEIIVKTLDHSLYIYNAQTHRGTQIKELNNRVLQVVSSPFSYSIVTTDGWLWAARTSKIRVGEPIVSLVQTDGAVAVLTQFGRVYVSGPTAYGGADTDGFVEGFETTFVEVEATRSLPILDDMSYVQDGGAVVKLYATHTDMFAETRDGSYYKWTRQRRAVRMPDINARNVSKIVHGNDDTAMITSTRAVYYFGPEKRPHYMPDASDAIDVVSSGRAFAVHSARYGGSVYVCGDAADGGVNEAGEAGWIGLTGVTTLRGEDGMFVASAETLNRATNIGTSVSYTWGNVTARMRFASFSWPATLDRIATNAATQTLVMVFNNGYIAVDGEIDRRQRAVCGAVSHEGGLVVFGPDQFVVLGECRTAA